MKSSLESSEELSIRLHSAKQVAGAAALGGPIAGVWLIARNRSRLKLESGGRYLTYVTVGTMLLFHLVTSIFPTDFPVQVGPVLSGAIFWVLFRRSLSEKYDAFINAGGKKASVWQAVLITVASIPLSLAGIWLLMAVLPIEPINHVSYSPSNVYYEGEATESDARSLGDLLQAEGFFNDDSSYHLTVQRSDASADQLANEVIIRWQTDLPPEPGTEGWLIFDNLRKAIQQLAFPNNEVRFIFENPWGMVTAKIPAQG